MKQINITTAVLLAIKGFEDENFSIYDVTKEIRSCVDKDYSIFGSSGNVPHDFVKFIFTELLENDLLSDYDAENSPNGYRVFSLADSKLVPTPSQPLPTLTLIQYPMPLGDQTKILNYVDDHSPVTMKRVQSRMKGSSYTCQEIKDFLESMGRLPSNVQDVAVSKVETL
tara:strand:- start:11076 stop:11582 length:507 start_codon:yes stop_codon:yes gene_type:complete